ncbi:MAG: site-specific integrase [Nitrosarchaeum sp.]|nr:site-specific integrase [Nitrosarchaeum sp.]
MEGKLNNTIREVENKTGVKYPKIQTGTMQRSLLLFQKSVKSKASFKVYKQYLDHFMKWSGYPKEKYDMLSIESKDKVQKMIEDYIMAETSDPTKSPNSGGVRVFALKAFFEINDVELKWKKILRLLPKKVKRTGKLAYTTRDIQEMLSVAKNQRARALILFLASTGVRVGAIIELKMKHIKDMPHGCKAFCIYEGSVEEYWTFCTPECSEELEKYLAKRKLEGEIFTPETPVFLAQNHNGTELLPMGQFAVYTSIRRVLMQAGRRDPKDATYQRYDKMTLHAFRKRFLTILKNTPNIKMATAERLVGHSTYKDEENRAITLDSSYYVPVIEELFYQYKLAIPSLTIDDMVRVKVKEAELEGRTKMISEQEKKTHSIQNRLFLLLLSQLKKNPNEIPDGFTQADIDELRYELDRIDA